MNPRWKFYFSAFDIDKFDNNLKDDHFNHYLMKLYMICTYNIPTLEYGYAE